MWSSSFSVTWIGVPSAARFVANVRRKSWSVQAANRARLVESDLGLAPAVEYRCGLVFQAVASRWEDVLVEAGDRFNSCGRQFPVWERVSPFVFRDRRGKRDSLRSRSEEHTSEIQ